MGRRAGAVARIAAGTLVVCGALDCSDAGVPGGTSETMQATALPALAAGALPNDTAAPSSPATYFKLSGAGIEVTYGPVAGEPALVYEDAIGSQTFRGDDIVVASTLAGATASVVIRHTIDSGSTTFTLLVPRVEVAASGSQQVQTVGITATHRFSVVRRFDDGQLDSYEVATLTGTATGKPPQVVPEPPWHSGLLP